MFSKIAIIGKPPTTQTFLGRLVRPPPPSLTSEAKRSREIHSCIAFRHFVTCASPSSTLINVHLRVNVPCMRPKKMAITVELMIITL